MSSTGLRLCYGPKRNKKLIIHCLFCGTTTTLIYSCYDITWNEGDFSFVFEVLDERKKSNNKGISSVFRGLRMAELNALDITLSDTQDSFPIEILIGATWLANFTTVRDMFCEAIWLQSAYF